MLLVSMLLFFFIICLKRNFQMCLSIGDNISKFMCLFFIFCFLSNEALGTDWHRIRWKKFGNHLFVSHFWIETWVCRSFMNVIGVEGKGKKTTDFNCRYIKWYQCHFVFLHYVCHIFWVFFFFFALKNFSFLINDSSICYYKHTDEI